jgi:curved DNA-binding protein CbpA
MEIICVSGEYYDPYFILGVTPDDDMKHITQAFRQRAKKYHPDKATKENVQKYEKRFNIIISSYEHIKNKRAERIRESTNSESENATPASNVYLNPNEHGYVPNSKRLEREDDYKKFDYRPAQQFDDGKKFSKREFNRMFEYLASAAKSSQSRALVHKTSDGFYGYNTADTGSCSSVASFNGLLITGDNFGESGVGYWDTGFADYRQSFSQVQNPTSKVRVPKEFSVDKNSTPKKPASREEVPGTSNDTFTTAQEKLFQKRVHELVEKEAADKKMVLKYAKQYNPQVLQAALNKSLEESPSLLTSLKSYYSSISF